MEKIHLILSYDNYLELNRYSKNSKPWVFEFETLQEDVVKPIEVHISSKPESPRYLIKHTDAKGFEVFIDDIILTGIYSKLTKSLEDIEYIKKLGIHKSFYGGKFELVREDSIDFPEYSI